MHLLDFYRDVSKHEELKQLFVLGSQKHPAGLPANFLEKDLWVTEILRLLYDERLMGDFSVAFKGGTALSKCWKVIDRFSEDIDLSIHWSELAGEEDEASAWEKSTQSGKQQKMFRKAQEIRLKGWSEDLVARINERFSEYGIAGLAAELQADSHGERVNVRFPRMTAGRSDYQLDYVLLEFGGRNRGLPTVEHSIGCYLAEIPEFNQIACPQAIVQAYDPAYILWEKLTALHQFSTMEREPKTNRLARHWYDVDCLLQKGIADPLNSTQAMKDVVEMKKQRWSERGVDYERVLRGEIQLTPNAERLAAIGKDHDAAVQGGMFYVQPDDFKHIISRVSELQYRINAMVKN